MGNELFHADRRTDITKLIERTNKTPNTKHNMKQITKLAILISLSQPRLQYVHLNPLKSNTNSLVASQV